MSQIAEFCYCTLHRCVFFLILTTSLFACGYCIMWCIRITSAEHPTTYYMHIARKRARIMSVRCQKRKFGKDALKDRELLVYRWSRALVRGKNMLRWPNHDDYDNWICMTERVRWCIHYHMMLVVVCCTHTTAHDYTHIDHLTAQLLSYGFYSTLYLHPRHN